MTHRSPRHRRLAASALAPLLLLTGACTGDGGGGDDRSPEEVLAAAKTQLDDTSGVSLTLSTDELPDGVDGVLEAVGVATHAPAFDGDLKVLVNNLTVDAAVISVDGEVYAELPFTSTFAPITPADYGAPDPAALLDPASGISTWLTAAEDVEEGEQSRDGEQVLTEYAGTLPGTAVAEVIPSADDAATFEVTFRVDDEDQLANARVVGPFYGDGGDVDYRISIDEYDVEQDITAP
jgi:lipoprotein LprG